MDVLDFDLVLEASDGDAYDVRASSPEGEVASRITLALTDAEIDEAIAIGAEGTADQADAASRATEFGSRLYDAVFAGEVGLLLAYTWRRARSERRGLRLRLRLGGAPRLTDLPWEFLQSAELGFFVLSAERSLVRYVELLEPVEALAVTPPLRLVCVTATPSDEAALDAARERRLLDEAVAPLVEAGRLEVVHLERATLAAVHDVLATSAVNILHFIGHGGYDRATNQGWLVFEDERSRSFSVPAETLATLLQDHDPLRLAVLNACQGASSTSVAPFSGVAPALARRGVPAVVAMQQEVSDAAAIGFSRTFYRVLASGDTIDAACAQARKAVHFGDDDLEWATPVLHLRAVDGVLFDFAASEGPLMSALSRLELSVTKVAAIATGVLAIATLANNALGVVAGVSLATAALCVAAAVGLLVAGLWRRGNAGPLVSTRLAIALAAVIAIAGLGPLAVKYGLAESDMSSGLANFDRQLYAAAVGPLERAERHFEEIGLAGRQQEARIPLVQTYAALGRWDAADRMTDEVLAKDPSEQVRAELTIARGWIEFQRGRLEQAEVLFQQAHQMVSPGSRGEAVLLFNEGSMLAERGGEFDGEARDRLARARQIYRDRGEVLGDAYVISIEGDLEQEPAARRALYEQALAIAEAHQDVLLASALLQRLGSGYRLEGDFAAAESFYHRSLEQAQVAADPVAQASVQLSLARLEQARGRSVAADQHVAQSEALIGVFGRDDEEAHTRTLAQLKVQQGDVLAESGDYAAAERIYASALDLYASHPAPVAEAAARLQVAALMIGTGRAQEARDELARAGELIDAFSNGRVTSHGIVLENNRGRLDHELGDLDGAMAHFEKAAALAERAGDLQQAALVDENIALISLQSGDLAAIGRLQRALESYRRLGNRDQEADVMATLAAVDPGGPLQGQMLRLLDEYDISRDIELQIYFSILPSTVGERADVARFEERLRQLVATFDAGTPQVQIALGHRALARAATTLQDREEAIAWARRAAPLADTIPRLQRGSFHMDLAFALSWTGTLDEALSQYWRAYALYVDLDLPSNAPIRDGLLALVSGYLADRPAEVDPGDQLAQAKRALDIAPEPQDRQQLESIIRDVEAWIDSGGS